MKAMNELDKAALDAWITREPDEMCICGEDDCIYPDCDADDYDEDVRNWWDQDQHIGRAYDEGDA